MFPDIGGESGAKLVVALGAVAIALLVFYVVLRTWRQRGTRAFLRGGKNRRPRLAVLDAAAVDPRRRLVLVRRDDVEHLILIGGPSDVVVESCIGVTDAGHDSASSPRTATEAPAPQRPEQETMAPAGSIPVSATLPQPEETDEIAPAASAGPQERAPVAEPAKAEPARSEVRRVPPPPGPGASEITDTGPAASAPGSGQDIANILDSHRQRVFGASERLEPSPYVRAYMDGEEDAVPGAATNTSPGPASSVLRFEDFLDTEVASELSWLEPERSSRDDGAAPVPERPATAPDAPAADTRSENTLDEEMSRLLRQLSHRR